MRGACASRPAWQQGSLSAGQTTSDLDRERGVGDAGMDDGKGCPPAACGSRNRRGRLTGRRSKAPKRGQRRERSSVAGRPSPCGAMSRTCFVRRPSSLSIVARIVTSGSTIAIAVASSSASSRHPPREGGARRQAELTPASRSVARTPILILRHATLIYIRSSWPDRPHAGRTDRFTLASVERVPRLAVAREPTPAPGVVGCPGRECRRIGCVAAAALQ